MSATVVWLQFLLLLGVVTVAGTRLSSYGEWIGQRTGLGTTWVGLILLATVTSLPELVTGTSAVALAGSPDIAVGTILGSCVFNLVILVIMDGLLEHESIYARVSANHLLSAGFGVILLGIVGFNLVIEGDLVPALDGVGVYAPVILLVYLGAVRSLHLYEVRHGGAESGDPAPEGPAPSGRTVYVGFAIASLFIIGAGAWLPFVGQDLAVVLGVRETFVGTLMVALVTSMPEIVVAGAAVRLGAPNMAVSNLLGSNLFNLVILVPEDVLHREGPILAAADPTHAISALAALSMTGIAMVALLLRPQTRIARLGATSLFLLAIYLIHAYVVFLGR